MQIVCESLRDAREAVHSIDSWLFGTECELTEAFDESVRAVRVLQDALHRMRPEQVHPQPLPTPVEEPCPST